MSHTHLRRSWYTWPLHMALAGLIMAGGSPTGAQPLKKPDIDRHVMEYLSFEKLPEATQKLIISAIDDYNNGKHQQSIETLKSLLAEKGIYKPERSLRAWSNQWLALNYFALHVDSLAIAKKYVDLSLEDDVEILREHVEFRRMPQDLREIYQESWQKLQDAFNRKRQSWRLSLGIISRVDFSRRFGFFDYVVGIGTPVIIKLNVPDEKSEFVSFKKLVLYTRMQWMRKNIERLTPGFYLEFSLLEEDLEKKDFTEGTMKFKKVLSGGAVVSYTWKSGWEMGGNVELARFLLDGGENDLKFSQTVFSGDLTLTVSRFELYVRMWF